MDGATSISPQPAAGLTVALWHDAQTAAPARLLSALSERAISIVQVTSPFMALATVCSRAKPGGGRLPAQAGALVIVNPEGQEHAAAVFEAASRYAPTCRCWMYSPGSTPPLRAVTEADAAGWRPAVRQPEIVVRPITPQSIGASGLRPPAPTPKPAPLARPAVPPAQGPRLRLAGGPKVDLPAQPADGEVSGAEKPAGPILTAEELRMLLGEDGPGGQT